MSDDLPDYINEYLKLDVEYIQQYGDKVAVLYTVGSFIELYGQEERMHQILYETLNISKRKIGNTEIYTGGFPDNALKKYIKLLIQSNYIAIVYEQAPDPKNSRKKIRVFSAKYSGPTCIDDEELSYENDLICCVYLEYLDSVISEVYLCTYEPSTGMNSAIVTNCKSYSEINKFVSKLNPKQIVIYTENCTIEKSNLTEYLNLKGKMFHLRMNCVPNEYKKISYQNEYLGKLFNSKLLTAIEYLNIGKYPTLVINYILLLSFLYEFNPLFLSKLSVPKISIDGTNLDYSANCLDEFNLIDKDKNSVFNIINHTSTLGGKRLLKRTLTSPSIDKTLINYRYDNIEKIIPEYKNFEQYLNQISDLEKFHRKIHLGKFKPAEFSYLDKSYTAILELIKLTEKFNVCSDLLNIEDKSIFTQFYGYYHSIINFNNLIDIENDVTENIFNTGFNAQLDKYFDYYTQLKNYLSNLSSVYANATNKTEPLKLEENKGKKTLAADEYVFHVNKSQKDILEKLYPELEFSGKSSGYRMSSVSIRDCSSKLSETQNNINNITRNLYSQFINYLSTTFHVLFDKITIFSNTVDMFKSGAKVAVLNKYCKPKIKENTKSFIHAKKLRHLCIEKILTNTQYVPNDCDLGDEVDGILLYGINGSGKSSYLRQIGTSIFLAQSGFYVPAEEFTYCIYNKLSIKITGTDDIYTHKSYFTNECLAVKNFLQIADQNTLIFGDELFKGTESKSELALVASAINFLSNKKCSFIFATHLHELLDLDIINSCNNIKSFHIDMKISSDKLEYDRTIKAGKSSKYYGIEIASFLGLDQNFVSEAYKVRNLLLNGTIEYCSTKKSNYNNNVYMDACKVCGSTKDLVTHHIKFQKEFIEGNSIPFDKNAPHNLAIICENCHNEVHNGKLNIKGYIQTSEGIKLDFVRN